MKTNQEYNTPNPAQLTQPDGVASEGNHQNTNANRLQQLEKQNYELKKLNEAHKKELAAIEVAHRKYIAVLAHDLKNPLSNIYTAMEILKNCIHDNRVDEMEEFIDFASGSVLNSTLMIENILAWIQSQSREKQFNPQRVSLYQLVEDEIQANTLALRIRKISISHSVSPGIYVLADMRMVQSVVRNLITNAIKYSHHGGHITISAANEKPYIKIIVKDDGVGISLQQQQELFEQKPFENSNGKNKGFGLLLCKEFIETHGGTLRVKSRQDHGSSFIFTLPSYD